MKFRKFSRAIALALLLSLPALAPLVATPVSAVGEGEGTAMIAPATVTAGSTGNTMTITYTAGVTAWNNGELEITIPTGWSAPSITATDPGYITASAGFVSVVGEVIIITGITTGAGTAVTVVYGDTTGGGPGATAQTTVGTPTFGIRSDPDGGGSPSEIASSPTVTVNPGPAASFNVVAPGTVTAGTSFKVTLTALDAYGNTATGYSGVISINFTSTATNSPNGTPPTIPSPKNINFKTGVGTRAGFILTNAGETPTISATDPAIPITGTSANITVTPAAASSLQVSGITDPVVAGTASDVTVTAFDPYGNTDTNYTGTITFTSSDAQAVLPADYTFLAGHNGVKTFAGGVTMKTAGEQSVTATDTVTPSITGSQTAITVTPAAAASFNVATSGGGTETAGVAFSITLTALDTYGNTATGYNGAAASIDFTSTATAAPDSTLPTIPTPQTLDFSVTPGIATATGFILVNAGETPTITATDGTISGTSAAITVNAVIDHYTVASASYAQARGVTFTVTVTAYDQYENLVTAGSSTQVTMSSSSATMAFDGDGNGAFREAGDDSKTLSAGTFDIQARDTTVGTGVTITATDSNAKTGTSSPYAIYALGGGGGGVGGGGRPTEYLTVDFLGEITGERITSDRRLLASLEAPSPDGMHLLEIDKDTRTLDNEGKIVELIEITEATTPPLPANTVVVGNAYDLRPSGITFDRPVRLTLSYPVSELPLNTLSVTMAYYSSESGWTGLEVESSQVAEIGSVIGLVDHFTIFAILAEVSPPEFTLANLTVSPEEVSPGEDVTIGVLVTNTGGSTGSLAVELGVDGDLEATGEVTLAPAASDTVTFTVTRDEAGTYAVTVDGLSGAFAVTAVTKEEFPWWAVWLGVGLGALLLAAITAYLLIWRRSRALA